MLPEDSPDMIVDIFYISSIGQGCCFGCRLIYKKSKGQLRVVKKIKRMIYRYLTKLGLTYSVYFSIDPFCKLINSKTDISLTWMPNNF